MAYLLFLVKFITWYLTFSFWMYDGKKDNLTPYNNLVSC